MESLTVRLILRDWFLNHLREMARQRHLREHMIDTPNGPQIAWVAWELNRMTALVNRIRVERDLPYVTREQVTRVEQQALGHFDYAEKFALYCAELALASKENK
jgi:hypothetical protein